MTQTMDGRLYGALSDPLGRRQRFYPPGQHPATRRHREYRKGLLRLPKSPERDDALAYVDLLLATFEENESMEKACYLAMLDRDDEHGQRTG